jgi:hypothetical protein
MSDALQPSRYADGMTTSGAGIAVMLLDLVKLGTVSLGLLGAGLAVLGGWHAYHTKKAERKLRELELAEKIKELEQ